MHGFRIQLRTLAARLATSMRQAFLSEGGATSIEYSFLVVLIAAIIVTVVGLIGQHLLPGFQIVEAGF
ncbi:Flp family type IVb pilin [Pseudarthrobacter sp. RMG13]|uniref:Flp family type IVb pilin n=1 Tax=Pseudarthrobacter humi TaxID=2952523 RepID=A0ABT1LKR5_9MICC|nr:Flp family type IVb pilin [Pseudarthrobacter humi]MCP8998426.1 Flp family type IVb pilin [Pseudarthrobacter humi]